MEPIDAGAGHTGPRWTGRGWRTAVFYALAQAVAAGCSPVEGPPEDLIGAIALTRAEEIPTVTTVTWETREPATCSIEYGPVGDLRYSVPEESAPGTSHSAFLLGLGPGAECGFRIHARTASRQETTEEQTFQTGFLPADAPALQRDVRDPAQVAGGFTLMPITKAGDGWISVLDAEGVLVWTYRAAYGVSSIELAPDGSGLYFNQPLQGGESGAEDGEAIHHVSWTGEELWSGGVPNGHHEFAILDDQTYAMLSGTSRVLNEGTGDEITLIGDAITEFSRDGDIRVVWDIFDHVDPAEAICTEPTPEPGGKLDWSHANYLRWDPELGAFHLIARHLDAVIAVDRASGEQLWGLSNTWGDIRAADGELLIDWPHSFEPAGSEFLIFNQVEDADPSFCSEAVRIAVDGAAGTATRTWRYQNELCSKVEHFGNAWPLPNGNTLVVFAPEGIVDEVDPGGTLVQRLQTELGWEFAYGTHVDSLYPQGEHE